MQHLDYSRMAEKIFSSLVTPKYIIKEVEFPLAQDQKKISTTSPLPVGKGLHVVWAPM